MLDQFSIFTKGGVVLWSRQLSPVKGRPIDTLVQTVFLEEKAGASTSFKYNPYVLKWLMDNELEIIFVAVYLNLTQVLFIEELLAAVRAEVVAHYRTDVRLHKGFQGFDERFDAILQEFEAKSRLKPQKVQRAFTETKRGLEVGRPSTDKRQEEDKTAHASSKDEGMKEQSTSDKGTAASREEEEFQRRLEREREAKLKRLGSRGSGPPGARGRRGGGTASQPRRTDRSSAPAAKGKSMRVWDESRVTKADLEELDFSKRGIDPEAAQAAEDEAVAATREVYGSKPQEGERIDWDGENDLSSEGEDDEEEVKKAPSKLGASSPTAGGKKRSGGFMSFLKGLAGQKVLDKEDLAPVLDTFRLHLMSKNVAADIAEKLVESVGVSLEGKQMESLSTVKSTVKAALEASLTRILTPARPIDVLQGVLAAQEQKRPYSIVFVGVNGVGKSTNLAKTAFYLLSHQFKVSIVACDTFRSGAVEQLKTHAKALEVPLFDRGYGKDAAGVAQEGIAWARRSGHDVVLIDTAGRMQDNDPLMKALAKLIQINKPDLILFVGEALVGNDGVDQLVKFNRALSDLSEDAQPRLIDGIILTKFDTIDDKVGAAISMTYSTGQPILFVGVGQTYKDLRHMNVKMLIKALLS